MNLSERLAAQALAITPDRLEARDVDQLARLLLDYAGCAYSGTHQPAAAALKRWAAAYAGAGRCGLLAGGPRVPAPVAALVNATAAHSYELDDTHDATLSHPGAVVISAALAVASETGSSGGEVMAAITAGYEAMTRIGAAANALNVIEFGFHPTGLFGGFGAATAAARLRGLEADTLLCAWGHALSMASGSTQFSDEAKGTDTKRAHAGYAAHAGVLAVELACHGLEAPRRAIDGKYGFLRLYGRDARPEILEEDGDNFAIHAISLKPYACCRQFHSAIDALRETTDGFAKVDAIRHITIRGPRIFADQHMLLRPRSPMAAQYSLPFVLGATLAFGPERFDAFASENLANPAILRWADMIGVEYDEELQACFPAHFGSEVEVVFADGETRTQRLLDSRGTPALPLSRAQIAAKAEGLVAGMAPELDMERLQEVILGLHEAPDTRDLDALLSADGVVGADRDRAEARPAAMGSGS